MISVATSPGPSRPSTPPTHASLREKANELRRMLQSPPAKPARLRWLADLCNDLHAFTDLLAEHFESEETDGAFHDLVAARPDLRPKVEQLGHQHRSIIQSLDLECRDLARRPTAEAAVKIIAILDRFQAHERLENDLLQGAVNDCLGEPD